MYHLNDIKKEEEYIHTKLPKMNLILIGNDFIIDYKRCFFMGYILFLIEHKVLKYLNDENLSILLRLVLCDDAVYNNSPSFD